jgi:flagellar hook-basal body complex protein FliE
MITSLPPVGAAGLGSVGSGASEASRGVARAGGADGNAFTSALRGVEDSLRTADALSRQVATGELTDLHQLTAATAKAQLGVELTVAVRNRAVEAFQEIMRMTV